MTGLTKKQIEILEKLRKAEDAEDWANAEIVKDGGECWIGDERISTRSLHGLISVMALHLDNLGGAEHYTINGTGRALLEDDGEGVYERILRAILSGWTVDEKGNGV